jgi:ketosteroid isomerase-like protein
MRTLVRIALFGLGCLALAALSVLGAPQPAAGSAADRAADKAEVKKVIEASIGWALEKDKALLYSSLAQDSAFFIFHPDSASTIEGFDAFRRFAERVFMNEAFKATGFEIKDLGVVFSESGTVAWFHAYLDDRGEWKGKPSSWINARWTGVLEKRDGKWVIVQMHFSFPEK